MVVCFTVLCDSSTTVLAGQSGVIVIHSTVLNGLYTPDCKTISTSGRPSQGIFFFFFYELKIEMPFYRNIK